MEQLALAGGGEKRLIYDANYAHRHERKRVIKMLRKDLWCLISETFIRVWRIIKVFALNVRLAFRGFIEFLLCPLNRPIYHRRGQKASRIPEMEAKRVETSR